MNRSIFGLVPVRTEVARFTVALGCVTLTLGCDFRHYDAVRGSTAVKSGSPHAGAAGASGAGSEDAGTPIVCPPIAPCPGKPEATCEPIGRTSKDLANLAKIPEPVAHLTFNVDPTRTERDPWADAVSGRSLLLNDDTAPALVDYPRINGRGHSIYLSGNAFAYLALDPPLTASSGFTLSVWISLERQTWLDSVYKTDVPFTWPILSAPTASGATSGGNAYQLALRRASKGGDFELVFSYPDASPTSIHEVRYSLKEKPSWAWQTGTWHHAAVVHWQDEQFAHSTLSWDGDETLDQAPRTANSASDASTSNSLEGLWVGGRADPDTPHFKGYLDEIALFNRPLSSEDLDRFTLSSTSEIGPSNCRWRAAENWNDTVVDEAISKTDWIESESNASSAVVEIDDQDWGAGSLQAILPTPLPLRNYRYAHLQASIEANSAFQLTLASGDTFCSWVAMGAGPTKAHYQFDLTKPMSCTSRTCEVGLTNIESISVSSEWSIPCASQPQDLCRDSRGSSRVRQLGVHKLAVSGIAFEPIGLAAPDWSAYDLTLGPNNWCWRPQAYEPEALATLSEPARPESVIAALTGPERTATRLVADFGDAGRDLSKCTSLEFLGTKASRGIPSFTIEDVYGSWGTVDLIGAFGVWDIKSLQYNSFNESARTSNFATFPKVFDYTKVRYLGVQKDWADITDERAKVTITGVKLLNNQGGPCQ